MNTTRKNIGNKFEQKAKRDLEERGFNVIDANQIRHNNPSFDLIINCSDGSQVPISVKGRTDTEQWPIANGKITRNPDGTYDGVEKLKEKLLERGFTFIYHELKKKGIDTVYIIPHSIIRPLLPLWVKHRTGGEHTFIINRKTATEIGLDIKLFERAWHQLPTP